MQLRPIAGKPLSPPRPVRWTLFCSVIDNLGDMGVSWRLARQLAHEYGAAVELWVDDWAALRQFLAPLADLPDHDSAELDQVQLRHWRSSWPANQFLDAEQSLKPDDRNLYLATSDVIVELFGCRLPEALMAALAVRATPPRWINIEYLSAEPWVAELHTLPSPQTIKIGQQLHSLAKTFFLPGFGPETGGLIRERDLLNQHAHWQANQRQLRRQLLTMTEPANERALWISLFCYATPSLASLLHALAAGTDHTILLIPAGKVAGHVSEALQLRHQPGAAEQHRVGNLTIVALPFVSQHDFDRHLSICDFNIVRGEDSFVRAQWAGKPLLWHIYPQQDGVHLGKLAAFTNLYLSAAPPP
jgi:uncharacterized repeat protein (TIGR03837 family)